MLQKFKTLLTTLTVTGTIFLPLAVLPAVASAQSTQSSLCTGASLQISTPANCNPAAGSSLDGIIKDVLNLISVIVGIIAVIMIVIGGLKYVMSGGESSKVSGAKDTILFAIVGLVVVALAQVIVHFVLTNIATNGHLGSGTGS